jgi:hypothetical protein
MLINTKFVKRNKYAHNIHKKYITQIFYSPISKEAA